VDARLYATKPPTTRIAGLTVRGGDVNLRGWKSAGRGY